MPTPTPLPSPERISEVTDYWGIVVPTWLGAVGSIAGAAVAAIAIILSLRNRGGLRTLAKGVRGGVAELDPQVGTPTLDPVRWVAWQEHRTSYKLRNDSQSTVAELLSFTDVTPGGDQAASTGMTFPVSLAGQESFPFIIDKTLVSPAVTAIRLEWNEGGQLHRSTVYV